MIEIWMRYPEKLAPGWQTHGMINTIPLSTLVTTFTNLTLSTVPGFGPRILLNTVLELLTSNRSELVLTSLEAYDLATNRKPNPRETVGSCYRNSGWIWLQAHIDQGFPLSLSSAFFQISSILKFHMGTTGYSRPPSA